MKLENSTLKKKTCLKLDIGSEQRFFQRRYQSVQFSRSLASDYLQPHTNSLQHSRLPCPSSTPRACYGGIEGCAHFLLRELQNCDLILNNHRQENVGCHQKKILHIQEQRRSPNKMVGGVKLHLDSNPIPTRDTQKAQTKLCAHQDPEDPHRLSQTHL